ncbi:shikimate dehydrogenase [Moraxella nasovis]|uniref:shikimate dehydrogenase n=1 Tax=Moraxella nasovis TaxID=2904121 RepID=UPI001F625EF3|nr:shikimate dehydrogenase [Moraxella nasovis]UNU74193.1 shikimate dehydrogenase [Moraxella nasovis]
MQHFIVIGNPISHSKSPDIHHAFADSLGKSIRYSREFCPDNFDSFCAVVSAFFHGGGTGANVTLPFKEMAFKLCQDTGMLSDHAKAAGAVNTLSMQDGKLYGDNTDGRGLVSDLQSQGINLQDKTVAIIGAGGATRGAILPLIEQGAKLHIFNRTLSKATSLVADFKSSADTLCAYELSKLSTGTHHFDVIINATSATTHSQTLALSQSLSADFAYDMMYGKPSEFLEHFKQRGAKLSDGYGMLIHQAALSFALWTNCQVSQSTLERLSNQ